MQLRGLRSPSLTTDGEEKAGLNAASPSLRCDLGAVSSSLNLRVFVSNVGMRIPTLECSIRGLEPGKGLSAGRVWPGQASRPPSARLPLETGQEPVLSSLHRAQCQEAGAGSWRPET